jgi:hypothetical protein
MLNQEDNSLALLGRNGKSAKLRASILVVTVGAAVCAGSFATHNPVNQTTPNPVNQT